MTSIAIPASVPTASRAPSTGRQVRFWRRRLAAVLVLVTLAFALTVAIGRVGAGAELSDRVAGHVVVQPGQTLWDVAAATSPDGVDTRRQLADLKTLNGLDSSRVDAWTVVLVPAR